MKTALISVDFDWFIRERLEWDWGHQETGLFLNEIWNIRYSMSNIDIFKETDINKFANFHPKRLLVELVEKGLIFSSTRFASAESHLAILQFYSNLNEPNLDLIVNIDAHHDLYGKPPSPGKEDCGNWWYTLIDKNPNSRNIWIFPDWLSEESEKKINRNIEIKSWNDFKIEEDVEVIGLFFCRSGCWVPPHHDENFNNMVSIINPNLCITPREILRRDK